MKHIIRSSVLFLSIIVLNAQILLSARFYDATQKIPNSAAIGPCMDVAAADLDGDGDLDVVLAQEFRANSILLNVGADGFIDVSRDNLPVVFDNNPSAGHDSEDIAIADFDRDNDLDIIFASEDDRTHEYYLNDGFGKFERAAYQLPQSTANAIVTTDVNDDGYPDIILGNAGQNTLLVNDGAGGFVDESLLRLPQNTNVTQDLKLADVDGDNDADLIVGNEDGNKLLIFEDGVFVDESILRLPQGVDMETRKVELADVDGDGDADMFLSNVNMRGGKDMLDRLYINDGAGFFSDETAERLPPVRRTTLDGIFIDVDLDGDRDLVVVYITGSAFRAFVNDGNGFFKDSADVVFAVPMTGPGLAVLASDFSGDGYPDLYFGLRGDGDRLLMFNPQLVDVAENTIDVEQGLTIFPNPCYDAVVTLGLPSIGETALITLRDLTGRIVHTLTTEGGATNDSLPLHVGDIAAGLYNITYCTRFGCVSSSLLKF